MPAQPDVNDLRKFCYQQLAQYKVPKDFEFVDQLAEDRQREDKDGRRRAWYICRKKAQESQG